MSVIGPSIISAGAPIEPGPPHPTIYLSNISEKIKPIKLQDLLLELFTPFGKIQRVIVKRRLALRGQAWIIFESTDSARQAISGMQGKRLWEEKTLKIRFARFPTSINSTDYRVRQEYRAQRAKEPRLTLRQKRLQLGSATPAMLAASALSTAVTGDAMSLPNKTLFVQQLPEGVDGAELQEIFKRFPGFVEVRVVPTRPDLVFVEFENEMVAAMARNSMDRQLLRPNTPQIKVTFAKR